MLSVTLPIPDFTFSAAVGSGGSEKLKVYGIGTSSLFLPDLLLYGYNFSAANLYSSARFDLV